MSPWFTPRPSLSGVGQGKLTAPTTVSPGFTPRPSGGTRTVNDQGHVTTEGGKASPNPLLPVIDRAHRSLQVALEELLRPAPWALPVPSADEVVTQEPDLGGSRSWSAACAIWPSGRITAWAIAPGSPSLADQEQADQVPTGTYAELARSGGLSVDTAHAVPDIGLLLAKVWSWKPNVVVCDPHRVAELHSCVGGRVRVVERARDGAETVSNIQALRSLLLDSTAGVTESSRDLLGAAFM